MNRSASIPINETVRDYLQQHFSEPPFFIAGVSGGPDSMALLYCLFQNKVNALVVHLNYQKRGAESDLDQELVEGFSAEWGFECCSVKVNPAGKEESNFQNWARKERYRIFRDLGREYDADAIITAHHKDDQVETILQKVLRGSGPPSWKGMQIREQDLFRPLLGFTKDEILTYCRRHNIPFRVDASNRESEYARNFLRNEFGPALHSFFPGWEDNILKLREYGQLNDKAVDHILKGISSGDKISVQKLTGMESGLIRSVIKRFAELYIPDITLSKGQLEELSEISSWETGKKMHLGQDHILYRDREYLTLKRSGDIRLKTTIEKKDAEYGIDITVAELKLKLNSGSSGELYMDASKLLWPLEVRNWMNGDSFKPLGMQGTQMVADHLTNRKISASNKENALILSGSDGTIYAIIYPEKAINGESGAVSERVKADATTKRYLTIIKKDKIV